jgi:uncharacterized protein YybS (DUF2232 family)
MSWLQVAKSSLLALASTVLLALFAAAIPLGGALLIPLVPQPALAFGLRHGTARAAGLVVLATAMVTLLGGRELGVGYSFIALMVLLLLFCFGRAWPIERVVTSTAAGMLAVLAASAVLLFGSVSGVHEGVRAALTEHMDASLDLYETVGFSTESVDLLRDRAPQIIDMFLTIMPALAFAALVAAILINLFFLLRRFPGRRSFLAATPDLTEWRSPEFLVWCFILSGFVLFVPGAEALRTLALNLFLMIAVFYFFQGLSIIAYYFHHKHVPFFLRSLAYVLIVFEQICTVFVVALGLFDLWGDFRRLKKKSLSPGSVG